MPDELPSSPEDRAAYRREAHQWNRKMLRAAAVSFLGIMGLVFLCGILVVLRGVFFENFFWIQELINGASVFVVGLCGVIFAFAAIVLADISEMLERE